MTLTAGILAMGRRQAERMMTDQCEVGVLSRGEIDDTTDEYAHVFTPVYVGPCRFKAGNVQARDVDVAAQLLVTQLATLSLPIDTSTKVRAGMQVRITASATDPALPGTVATVKAPFRSADTTARRFPVEVTDG